MKHWRALATVCFSTMKDRRVLRGVVFDMDGTLTVPNLDFAAMYHQCGVDPSDDILTVLRELPEAEAKAKYAIIEGMEAEAIRTMKLMPGAQEVTNWLRAHGIPTALVTRNTHRSAQALEEHLPHFDIIIARDHHEEIPPKPDPAAMLYIAQQWKVDPSSLVMVGDSPANDIVFGQAAGAMTALLDTGRRHIDSDKAEGVHADWTVEHLHVLPSHLWEDVLIEGSPLGQANRLHKVPAPVPSKPTTQAAVDGLLHHLDWSLCNTPDCTGNTPLIWAADAGQPHVVGKLLDERVDLDVRGYLGATAVCRASRRGHTDILEMLLTAGANADIGNDKMQYPLHFAAFKENKEAVEILLKHGAKKLVLDRKGRIPAEDTKSDMIRQLILSSMR